jgi:hypothetical protein
MNYSPPQRFVGYPFSTKEQQTVLDWQESPERREAIARVIGEEVPTSAEQHAQFKEVRYAIEDYYYRQLGLEVAPRLPDGEHFHILSPDKFTALRQKLGVHVDNMNVSAFPLELKDLVLRQSDDAASLAYAAQHEIIHLLGQQRTELRNRNGIAAQPVTRGFATPKANSFDVMEEYVTERTNHEITEEYWSFYDSLERLQPAITGTGHKESMRVGDLLLQGMSQHQGRDETEIFRELQKAHYQGDMKYLRSVYETWGGDVMKQLSVSDVTLGASALAVKLETMMPELEQRQTLN